MTAVDAVVVGSGPNGLAAAITLAKAGKSVVVLEANDTIGGAARSAELTEPGFIHDLGSAIHPMVKASPFFISIADELVEHGLEWIEPPAGAAHPLDDGRAGIAWHDFERTIDDLGTDGSAYRRYYSPFIENVDALTELALRPLIRVPKHPLFSARFGIAGAPPAATTARKVWKGDEAQGLFIGHAAHSILPLTAPFTSTFGLLLGSFIHSVGWGFPRGGAQSIIDAMVGVFERLGGEVRTDHLVRSMSDIPTARATIFSTTPSQLESIVGDRFPGKYRAKLNSWKHGPGAFKIDYALDGPIPWANADVSQAGTVHLGGTVDEIVRAEAEVAAGDHSAAPFVLVAQHTNFDPSRAPAGKHTAWAYCHVPNGSTLDQTQAIEDQIERFAPGFRDVVRTRHRTFAPSLEATNMNLVGGDIGGGSHQGMQLVARPMLQANPFDTADDAIFLASASTTPGAGVHGMAGSGAAERALEKVFS